MDEIIVNGETYVKKKPSGNIKICILQRGWVMVGRFHREGSECILTDAKNIRRWGTVGIGLGYIALNGPTQETILDVAGTVRFDYLTTIAVLDCSEVWNERL